MLELPYKVFHKRDEGWYVECNIEGADDTSEWGPFDTQEQATEFGQNQTGTRPNKKFNEFQIAAAKSYAGGDLYHVVTDDTPLSDVGDTLFTFLMIELSTKEGCDDPLVAVQRVETALKDMYAVLQELSAKYGIEQNLYVSET